MAEALIILLAFAAYSLFSKALTRTVLTLPILFTGLGLALSGPLHDAFPGEVIHSGKVFLAEATLILVLFADASHVRFRRLILSWTLPARMLLTSGPVSTMPASVNSESS